MKPSKEPKQESEFLVPMPVRLVTAVVPRRVPKRRYVLLVKVKGRYLVTAQLDSTEEELEDLFGNLGEKSPDSVFRRLDPDRYYPVYGDDSTTWSDTNTQGRFYVRVDWDRSEALWGNYHTGITGTEFGQYNRSLYGAKYHHRSPAISEGLPLEDRAQFLEFVHDHQTGGPHLAGERRIEQVGTRHTLVQVPAGGTNPP